MSILFFLLKNILGRLIQDVHNMIKYNKERKMNRADEKNLNELELERKYTGNKRNLFFFVYIVFVAWQNK